MEPTRTIEKASPKEVFLHLFSIIALYLAAVNVGTILFQFVNLSFPDALQGDLRYAGESARSLIRFAVASLVVAFPAYLWTMRVLGQQYAADPVRRQVRIRKWLIYLTLFIAGLIIIGDLIALIYSFLGGELTIRFILKVASVFVIAAAVFWYYRQEAKSTT